ncbi:Ankyrin repeat-containing domain protein [Elaphomyces granulatus]
MPVAIRASLAASHVLFLVDGDEDLAVLWTLWRLNDNSVQRDTWKERLTSASHLSALLELFPRAPLETFQLLKSNPDFVAAKAETILSTAIRQGVTTVVSYFFDLLKPDNPLVFHLPWQSCAREGNTVLLEKLASAWPAVAGQERNKLGSALLCEAVKHGHLGAVKILLRCDFDSEDNDSDSANALTIASKMGFIEILQYMRDKHADSLLKKSGKAKVLYTACQMGFLEVTKILTRDLDSMDLSALLCIAAKFGRSGVVRSQGHVDVVAELLDNLADGWAKDSSGNTPLSWAAKAGHGDVVKLLLAKLPGREGLNRALLCATSRGDAAIMTQLLDAGADKNYAWENTTPLHLAAHNGYDDSVRLLIMRHAALNNQGIKGNTPVADACSTGKLEPVRMLVEAGASLEIKDWMSRSPLQRAALGNHSAIVRLLLERGVAWEVDLPECGSLVVQLVHKRYIDTVKVVLDSAAAQVTSDLLGECAHIALRNDDTEMLLLLLDRGADLDAESAKKGFGTALQECAYHGNLKMAKVLIHRLHVDVNANQGRYHTALIASVCRRENPGEEQRKRRHKMIKFLLEQGAHRASRGGWYGTLLNAAAACASKDLLQFVLEDIDVPVRWVDSEGRLATHMAAMAPCDHIEKLKLLCDKGSQVLLLTSDFQGRKPLHFACGHGLLRVVQYLLRFKRIKSDIDAQDSDGWTPLHWACRQRDVDVVLFLLASNANANTRTNKRWTPRHVAMFHDHDTIARILSKDEEPPNQEKPPSEEKPPNVEEPPTSPGVKHNETCASCLLEIVGIKWKCDSCEDFHLCFKCHEHLNQSGHKHTFTPFGKMYQ